MTLYDQQAQDPIRTPYTTCGKEIIPLSDVILVYDMFFGEEILSSGIVLLNDNATDRGIHPRWAKVYAVGKKHQAHVSKDEWVLIEHGRWGRAIIVNLEGFNEPISLRQADPKALLMSSKTDPSII